ncbi:unnamed protein product [Mucor hiemalis]
MQIHPVNEAFHFNSFMYSFENASSSPSATTYVSPKEYQKRSPSSFDCNIMPSLLSSRKVCKKSNNKSKKIILGKPIVDGKKQKMSLQELKALSRQVRPIVKQQKKTDDDIVAISRNLRENLFKAKSKMMDSLKNSNTPKDLQMYEFLNKDSESMPSSPSYTSSEEDYDDDCHSVNSTHLSLRLVTNDSGSVSVVPSSVCQSSSASTVSSLDDSLMNETIFGDESPLMPLYTPSIMNMEIFFQSPFWTPKTMPCTNNDVTEDQINSWLQRGGFGDHMSPITMATDQELADLLDFDM